MGKRQLNIKQVESLMRRPGTWWTAPGLYLQVRDDNACSWITRFQLAGRPRNMGHGGVEFLTFGQALDLNHEARKLVREGVDPIEARKARRLAERLKQQSSKTFRAAAEEYIQLQTPGWSNPRTADIWRSSMEMYVHGVFGDVSVAEVTSALVRQAVAPVWEKKQPTAKRLRQRIESVIEWATAHGLRTGENPARKEILEALLSRQSHQVQHRTALAYAELPAFMKALRARSGIGERALELCILTALRTSELLGAKWDEFDLNEKVWTVPGSRMKMRKEHRIPLSAAALDLLRELEKGRTSGYVFPAMRGEGKPINERAMREVLKAMGRDLDVHGFRSSFRDWASETTNHDANTCEAALAHQIKSEVEKAYRRGDLFAKRRLLMSDWSDFCAGRPAQGGNVVPMRANA